MCVPVIYILNKQSQVRGERDLLDGVEFRVEPSVAGATLRRKLNTANVFCVSALFSNRYGGKVRPHALCRMIRLETTDIES